MEDADGGRSRRHEFDGETNGSNTHLTLGGILSIKETTSYRIHNRTLLDLIRDDPTSCKESKKTWKMLTEKLRLKLAGSGCTTTVPTVASHVHITTDRNGMTMRNGTDRSDSPPVNNASAITADVRSEPPVTVEENEQTVTEEIRRDGGERGGPATVKVSLMSLLEVDGSANFVNDDDDYDEEEAVEGEGEGGGGGGDGGGGKYNNCCVCMVRHKGAAFIPCGHTFCRVCSRELFVKRASCPLCNHFISEILDIF